MPPLFVLLQYFLSVDLPHAPNQTKLFNASGDFIGRTSWYDVFETDRPSVELWHEASGAVIRGNESSVSLANCTVVPVFPAVDGYDENGTVASVRFTNVTSCSTLTVSFDLSTAPNVAPGLHSVHVRNPWPVRILVLRFDPEFVLLLGVDVGIALGRRKGGEGLS